VFFEVVRGPVIEGVGEEESAAAAAAVIDGRAGERQFDAVGDLTISIEIDEAEKRGRLPANFAGHCLSGSRFKTQHHLIFGLPAT
jgi:hypothetical protein